TLDVIIPVNNPKIPGASNAQTMLKEAYNLSIVESDYVKDPGTNNVPIYVVALGPPAPEAPVPTCLDGSPMPVGGISACTPVTCPDIPGLTLTTPTVPNGHSTAECKYTCPDNSVYNGVSCTPVNCPDITG